MSLIFLGVLHRRWSKVAYDDEISPALKETGKFGEVVVKTLRLVLALIDQTLEEWAPLGLLAFMRRSQPDGRQARCGRTATGRNDVESEAVWQIAKSPQRSPDG